MTVRTALAIVAFIAALAILIAVGAAIVSGSTWFLSEVVMRIFPLDYGRVSYDP
ncbi:hypothetical protein [Microbacterium sp. ZXX196]|uniref:hypothetical protein n=1 Tax=Microbacterium sp. ZXX196 TaxID=2609291 RepID=UPI0012B77CAD|nr:hypothetical protein [Microbacterium sp. ZXX196]MTE24748.1 hypothetical protein [Microbacterium sp. ZXX196]